MTKIAFLIKREKLANIFRCKLMRPTSRAHTILRLKFYLLNLISLRENVLLLETQLKLTEPFCQRTLLVPEVKPEEKINTLCSEKA